MVTLKYLAAAAFSMIRQRLEFPYPNRRKLIFFTV